MYMNKDAGVLDRMLELWEYNPTLGKIVNKRTKRPLKGRPNTHNYLRVCIRINGRRLDVYYSRAVWALCHEQWPEAEIDHLNGDTHDNRIENLRECSQSENNYNSYYPWVPNEVTQIPGVYLHNKNGNDYEFRVREKNYRRASAHQCFWLTILMGRRYK